MNQESLIRLLSLLVIFSALSTISCTNNPQSQSQPLAQGNGNIPKQENQKIEQAVIIYLKLSNDKFGEAKEREALFRLEDELESKVAAGGAGEYDGHEFGGGYGTLYMYGSDADKLFNVVIESIRKHNPRTGSYIIKRYGGVGAKEEKVKL
jgi:hypothetical protein